MDERMVQRFWKHVKRGGADECWLWTSSRTPKGYGQLTVNNKVAYAHRLSYEIHHGPVPAGMYVCHSCDMPTCVNPAHLWAGTARQNTLDMVHKGRAAQSFIKYGADNPNSKLTDEQVRTIRAVCGREPGLQATMARQYGVTESTISRIIRGHTRKHVK